MLDMSWGEVMLIGGVALIVIGPKDLPKALRTLGQVTGKVRRMAGEFQHQFNEAIREAELDEIRKDVEGVKQKAESYRPSFNPVDTIRNELKNAVDGRNAAKGGAAKGEATPAGDPLESAAPAALTKATEEETARLVRGGSYDVPRPTEPPIDAVPQPPDVTPEDIVKTPPDGRTP